MADVEAAGGVICRLSKKGRFQVLVVHRPHRSDWTFPKGKLDPGEDHETAALREVREETGFKCTTATRLPSAKYVLSSGLSKRVKYWIMLPVGGKFAPNTEVDEVQWLTPRSAGKKLTYDSDRQVLADALVALGF